MSVRVAGKTPIYFQGEQSLNEAGNMMIYDTKKKKKWQKH